MLTIDPQFWGVRSAVYDNEAGKALWCGVIEQAFKDLTLKPTRLASTTTRDTMRQARESAAWWFFDGDSELENSFENLCDVLGFSPGALRLVALKVLKTRRLPEELRRYIYNNGTMRKLKVGYV